MAISIDLTGRTIAVVGGGGGGIGTSICERLAIAGADIAALSAEAAHVDDTVERVEALGRAATGQVVDVRDADGLTAALDAAAADAGRFDGLVNVVGGVQVPYWDRLLDYPIETFDHLIATNLRYALVGCAHVARGLVDAGRPGSMVNISSIASRSAPLMAGYGAAKAGLDALTRTMSAEWGRFGIRVNNVAPGSINTPRSGRSDSDLVDDAAKQIPLGRRGTPQDVADATAFLLSDVAGYITGHTLVVDGGASYRSAGLDDSDLPAQVTNPAIRARFESDGAT
ncbi:MAG: SDR family oxidoreductase [Acidimicrobiales bacterium]|nr:SDR family oxidoreductase [Acidimicrobiales bacterium]